MLDSKLAQRIVDRTMTALNINVNIMDVNGMVIAAGHKDRIGQFHPAAANVIKTGKKQTVTENEARRMEGVKPGITLPIKYKNDVIGAIGMTGDPSIVEPYGELVSLTAVLIIEQEEVQERAFQRQRAKNNLLIDLFLGRALDEEGVFLQRAKMLEIDLNKCYTIMTACVVTDDIAEKADSLQKLKDYINTRFFTNNRSITGCFVNDTLVLMSPLNEKQLSDRNHRMKVAEILYSQLQSIVSSNILLAIGGSCADWHPVPELYINAKEILRVARQHGLHRGVFFADDYCLAHTLSKIPVDYQVNYCRSVLKELLHCPIDQRDMFLLTLHTYYKNEKNVQITADELFIHRNTLHARLARIAALTGHVPNKFNDACALKVALNLLQDMDIFKKIEMEE